MITLQKTEYANGITATLIINNVKRTEKYFAEEEEFNEYKQFLISLYNILGLKVTYETK